MDATRLHDRSSGPKSTKTLGNALNTHFGGKPEPAEIDRVIAELVLRGVISVTDGKVAYT